MCIYIYRSIYIDLSIFIYICISVSFHRWLFGGKTPISWGVQGIIFAFSSSILRLSLKLSDTTSLSALNTNHAGDNFRVLALASG